jgi:hypothetical protein
MDANFRLSLSQGKGGPGRDRWQLELYTLSMPAPILATKLYIPLPRAKTVLRPRLIERLNEGLFSGCKLTLISASAGFGKTTLVSEWVAGCDRPVASIDSFLACQVLTYFALANAFKQSVDVGLAQLVMKGEILADAGRFRRNA